MVHENCVFQGRRAVFGLLGLAFLCLGPTMAVPAFAEVIYLTSRDGADRFQRSASQPSGLALFAFIETEAHLTFCGPASLAAVLNSLGVLDPTPAPLYPYHLVSQESVFTAANQAVRKYADVERDGLTLDQLAQFAANLHVSTQVVHALDVSGDEMRRLMRAALSSPDTRVIVNYTRRTLGQDGDGHISPVAAYDAQTDSFLVLDVARYKYVPAWITFDLLLQAMTEEDSSSHRPRGMLIVSRIADAPAQ